MQCVLILNFIADDSIWKTDKFESRLFQQHQRTKNHRKQDAAKVEKGQKTIYHSSTTDTLDDIAIWTRIQAAWWLAKEDVALHKFSSLVESQLVDRGLAPPKNYRDDKVAWEMTGILADHFRQLLKQRVKKSPYFGIMVDEATDNSTNQQLIVFIKFLDQVCGDFVVTVEYLDLVPLDSSSAEDITVLICMLFDRLMC